MSGLGLVIGLHLLMGLLLWQGMQRPMPAPLRVLIPVHWIAPAPAKPTAIPPQPHNIAAKPATAAPVLALPREATEPAPRAALVVTEAPPAVQLATPAAISAPPAPAPVVVTPSAVPQKIALNAPRYLAEPHLNMPLASRRLGEQGLVQLRLHIGPQGELMEASVARSSGFERLDAQALKDIRSARFAPLLDNGRPVEWEAMALLSYELTR